MPRRNTKLVRVEKRYVTVERIARHYTLFLCQNGVLNQAIVARLFGMCAYFASGGFYGARFIEMASRDTFKLLATPVDLWNLH